MQHIVSSEKERRLALPWMRTELTHRLGAHTVVQTVPVAHFF